MSEPDDGLQQARMLALMAWPGLAAALLTLLIPQRPDRTGHFLAGFGATLGAAWVAALATRGSRGAVVIATLGCIGLGHLVETYVFPLGGYDVLDVAAQSVGAVHAGCALLLGRAGDPDLDWFDAASLSPSPYGRRIVAVSAVSLVLGAWRAFA